MTRVRMVQLLTVAASACQDLLLHTEDRMYTAEPSLFYHYTYMTRVMWLLTVAAFVCYDLLFRTEDMMYTA